MPKKPKKKKILSDAQIAKKYGSGIASVIGLTPENLLRIPTRIIKLNHQLNGGLGYGKIIEVYGEESGGKSLLAMEFAYCTQQLGGSVLWADPENSWTNDWAQKNGVDPTNVYLLTQNSSVEMISDWTQDMILTARSRLTANEPLLLVVDSVAALRCTAEIMESQMDAKAKFGNRAKAISDFLGNRNELFARAGVSVIFINQIRKKIGASKYEDPDKTVGGDALKFYAHQRIGLFPGKQIKAKVKSKEYRVGKNVYIRTKKDKTGPPRETTEAKVLFTKSNQGPIGFLKYVGLPELLAEKGILERKKGGSRYYFKGSMLANGEENMMKLLIEDDDLRARLIKKSGINTISRTRAMIEATTKNLYPIKLKTDEPDGE
jgi:recombination protein RecA